MDHRLHYAREKFGIALNSLATSANSLQARLQSAYMSFHPIREDDFANSEMRATYAEIIARLTAVKDGPETNGYLRNTLDQMSDAEAEGIAELIYNLSMEIIDSEES